LSMLCVRSGIHRVVSVCAPLTPLRLAMLLLNGVSTE
jgi:hypothetical protein